jgi:hypothetical protein
MIITHYLYIRPSSRMPHSLCRQFLWYIPLLHFQQVKEKPWSPRAFPPSYPALPSHPLQKPLHSLCKWFLWSILLLHFQQVKGKSWSITMMESTTEANATKIQFNSSLYYFMIHFMTDKQCRVCGMCLVLMKWKHTLKVTKWQQTHRTSFMSFDVSIKIHHGSKRLQDLIQFTPLLFYNSFHDGWWCTICGMWLVLMKWTHSAYFMTHDYINHFNISINTTEMGNPQKSPIFQSLITSTDTTGPYYSKW